MNQKKQNNMTFELHPPVAGIVAITVTFFFTYGLGSFGLDITKWLAKRYYDKKNNDSHAG